MTPELARATLGAIEQRQDALEAEAAALERLAEAATFYLMTIGAPYDGRQAQPGGSGPAGAAVDAGEVEEAPPSPVAAPHACPRCERTFGTAHAVRIHIARGHQAEEPPRSENGAAEEPRDPRVIDETCRKCGKRFRWQPALTSHERTCRGAREDVSAPGAAAS